MATTPDPTLDVRRSRSDNSEVIVCRGRLDADTCQGLQAQIDDALDGRVDRMRIDLLDVVALDDAGLSCLQQCAERCEAYGIGLEITCAGDVRRALSTGATRSAVA
ncbi:MAG TPA: STAS domain-containing protein [Gaiellales bacterium]|jgi:anti-anti-sigma regulatory factor